MSPASWLIPKVFLKTPETLETWLAQQELTLPLKAGRSDQTLYFDPAKKLDRWALWQYCRQQQGECYLAETLADPCNLLSDEHGNAYFAQYVASLSHRDEIYTGAIIQPEQSQQLFLPGSDWLYAKVYCHPQTSNMLLATLMKQLLKDNKKLLKKWFFIRYQDRKPHIRLRMQLKQAEYNWPILSAIERELAVHMQTGRASEFSLHPYEPETQRYGPTRMELVEEFFHLDSSYALQVINSVTDLRTLQSVALGNIILWCSVVLKTTAAQLAFAKKMFGYFAEEFRLTTAEFKQLNADFKAFQKQHSTQDFPAARTLYIKRTQVFKRIISLCENKTVAEKMLADLVHMHINRLFSNGQRPQELVLYHHLEQIVARVSKFTMSKLQ